MHWTYPKDGATNVPTNASFWIVTNLGSGTAQLDETPPSAGRYGELLWGNLQPNHDYVITSTFANDAQVTIRFRTGTGPATTPGPLAIDGHTSGGGGPGANADSCFDTPPYTRLALHPNEASGVVGYLVDGVVYPAEHGDPATYITGESVEGACVDLAPIGRGGLVGPASSYCVPKDSDEGCSAAGGAHGGWFALLALTLLARRRRGS